MTLKNTLLTVVCNDHLNLNMDYLKPTLYITVFGLLKMEANFVNR